MASFQKFHSFVQKLGEKEHDLENDQLVVALTNTAPVATNTVLANITEITYTNLSSRDLTTTSWTNTSGTSALVLENLTLTASGAVPEFRYVVVYNDDATNKELVGFYDHGSGVTLQDGETFVIDFTNDNELLVLV
jgi:hypothetical protein